MKMALAVSTGIAITLLTASARIGESTEECAVRYGPPRKVNLDDQNTGVSIFSKNDLEIKIHFTNGSADLINYGPGQVARIEFDTAEYLVEVNGRNKEWKQLTDTKTFIHDIQDEYAQKVRWRYVDPIQWETKDGVLVASYSDSKGILEIKASTAQQKIRQGL